MKIVLVLRASLPTRKFRKIFRTRTANCEKVRFVATLFELTMSYSHRPVQAPPPFPPPILLTARRTMGTVNTEVQAVNSATPPPLLERKSSLAGNILLIQDNHGSKAKTSAYLLQRKIKDSIHGGSVRVGFVLRDPSRSETGVWELEPSGSSDEPHQMVAVKIDDKTKLSRGQEENSPQTQDPMNELSVLQWITANDPDGKGHLLAPTILAEDSLHIYTITPYQNEGTLFDYCDTVGKLSESEVRFFFRQILEVSRKSDGKWVKNLVVSMIDVGETPWVAYHRYSTFSLLLVYTGSGKLETLRNLS
jgi:hypothetical protein